MGPFGALRRRDRLKHDANKSPEAGMGLGAFVWSGRLSPDSKSRAEPADHIALRIESTIFLASPNSIVVFWRKNSSFSTPA
ncbi:hypothetical protein MGN01_09830 [Methylobacterium gnaphalii]|uniref:Uncharacterized protein n=1 Tax=Methylobacterium gnaphalii TaxID=1010610 RepID=A0A512JGP8_9HYPH|nr:hypothetical protein MGN01_09830 [Methylobacterium gnaphalii]GLS50579.1 hypothetical protein GCM10007885_34320 [Methylobacterium gnaphalii]